MAYNMKKHLRHSEAHAERGLLLFRAVAFTVCAMFAVLYAQTPLYADDLWYLEGMKPQTSGFRAFVACLHTVGRHWLHDTGRLANLICPPFLTLMPKWVYGIMIAAAIYVLIDYGRRISQAPPLSVRAGLWLVAVVFAFPWLDCMLSVVFSLNYVLPAAMSAVLVWYLLQGVHGRRYGRAGTMWLSLLAFATAWMHEGLSVPLAAAMAAYVLFGDRSRLGNVRWPLVAFAAGCFAIFVAPAFWNRLGNVEGNLPRRTRWEWVANFVAFNFFSYAYVAFMAFSLCFRRVRRKMTAGTVFGGQAAGFLAFALASTAMMALFMVGPRVGAFAQMAGAAGVLWLGSLYPVVLRRRMPALAGWAVLVAMCMVSMAVSLAVQPRLEREYMQVVEQAATSDDGAVFVDCTDMRPGIDFFRPAYSLTSFALSNERAGNFYCGRPVYILPRALWLRGLACHGVCFGQRVAAFRRQGGVPRECAAQQHAPGAHTCRRRTVGNALSGTQLHRRRRLAVCMAPPPCLVHRQDSPCRRCPQGGAVAPWRECDSAEKNDSPRRLPRAVALFFFPADDYLPKKRL